MLVSRLNIKKVTRRFHLDVANEKREKKTIQFNTNLLNKHIWNDTHKKTIYSVINAKVRVYSGRTLHDIKLWGCKSDDDAVDANAQIQNG